MAVVHAGKGRLPDARALLYYECIDLLLLRWRQEPGHPDVIEQLALPQFRASDLLALMARIGFAAHEAAARDSGQAERPANLGREQVQRLLEETLAPYSAGDPVRRDTLVSQLLHAIALRNGLLLKQSGEQGESYAFPHRTFQEFLAGYHLKGQRDYRRLCLERAPQTHWHEALALMVGYQVLADRELEKPLDLAERLLVRTPAEQALAGELLVLIGRERAASYDGALVGREGLWPRARATLLRLATLGQAPRGTGYAARARWPGAGPAVLWRTGDALPARHAHPAARPAAAAGGGRCVIKPERRPGVRRWTSTGARSQSGPFW